MYGLLTLSFLRTVENYIQVKFFWWNSVIFLEYPTLSSFSDSQVSDRRLLVFLFFAYSLVVVHTDLDPRVLRQKEVENHRKKTLSK